MSAFFRSAMIVLIRFWIRERIQIQDNIIILSLSLPEQSYIADAPYAPIADSVWWSTRASFVLAQFSLLLGVDT